MVKEEWNKFRGNMIAIFEYLKYYYVAERRGNRAIFLWEELDRSYREPDK